MVSGVRQFGEQDYPPTVREAVTPLPYHGGGSVTLTAGEVRDLIKVRDLRRFENIGQVASGVHRGQVAADTLLDSSATFREWGVELGDTLFNITQTTNGPITTVTETTIVAMGVSWNVSDIYQVVKNNAFNDARATEIRRISLTTDLPLYVAYDREVVALNGYNVEMKGGEAYYEEHIRIVSRVSVMAVSATDTPKVRFTVWGI